MDGAATAESDTQTQAGKKKKRFQCPDCDRLFARLEHLQRHERIRKPNPKMQVLPTDKRKTVVKNPSVVRNVITLLPAGMNINPYCNDEAYDDEVICSSAMSV